MLGQHLRAYIHLQPEPRWFCCSLVLPALDALEQPHPTAPSTLNSLTFLTHPHWSKQSSQTFWFGKGIDHENLSLFHLNIKLKSKQYKVHFLMCCPIPVGLLSLFFLGEL